MLFRALLNLLSDIPLQNLKMLGFFWQLDPNCVTKACDMGDRFQSPPPFEVQEM